MREAGGVCVRERERRYMLHHSSSPYNYITPTPKHAKVNYSRTHFPTRYMYRVHVHGTRNIHRLLCSTLQLSRTCTSLYSSYSSIRYEVQLYHSQVIPKFLPFS